MLLHGLKTLTITVPKQTFPIGFNCSLNVAFSHNFQITHEFSMEEKTKGP